VIVRYLCNVCGSLQEFPRESLEREAPSCRCCGSSIRRRGIVHCLSLALFGESLPLPDFPSRPDLRGVGLSDWPASAVRLADKVDYRNSFPNRPPLPDICAPPPHMAGGYDFVVLPDAGEEFLRRADRAFRGAASILKEGGVIVLSSGDGFPPDGPARAPIAAHLEAAGFGPVGFHDGQVAEYGIYPAGFGLSASARKAGGAAAIGRRCE